MSKFAISTENLSKSYRLASNRRKRVQYRMLREELQSSVSSLVNRFSASGTNEQSQGKVTLWALKDVNFEIPHGTTLGIIGSNGAGKTTLLKLLSRVTIPTYGRALLYGRVGSLLEVGTGFHPELTGRENIYLNGAILGMTHHEIVRKFDEIVDFSEVEDFLNTPVKFYSSGMRVRLAFSVAAHLEPEILLVDEVLAVGDIAFQKKSLNKMGEVAKGGRTVLFVSHNLAAVRALCQSGIYLEHGKIQHLGDISSSISAYLSAGALQSSASVSREIKVNIPVQIIGVEIIGNANESGIQLPHDQPFTVRLKIAVNRIIQKSFITLHILDKDLDPIFSGSDFEFDESGMENRTPGIYTYDIRIPAPFLIPGNYRLSVETSAKSLQRTFPIDSVEHICPFDIFDNGSILAQVGVKWAGKVKPSLTWSCLKKDLHL
jgi:lipopolysaccharide transport system ATP-binding protein